MEYPGISIDQDVNTGNDSKVKVMEEVVMPTEIKETKKYIEETTKPIETIEPAPISSTLSNEEALKWLEDNRNRKTDPLGLPYLEKGKEHTWSASGEPNEAPRGLKNTAVNPNTGIKYRYNDVNGWHVDTSEQDAERARLIMEEDYVTDSNGNLVKGHKLSEEDARKFAKMFSDSFK